jgi:hypothetical protein
MRAKIVFAALIAATLAACETETVPGGTAPFVSRDPIKFQSKVTHAVNWQEMAQRAVTAIPWSGPGADKLPAYVKLGDNVPPDSPFADAYHHFLQEELLKANYPVVQQEADAHIVIDFDIRPLIYPDITTTNGEDTPTEIVVTTRIADREHVHYLKTETIYVKPTDLAQYAPPPAELPVATLPVNGIRR